MKETDPLVFAFVFELEATAGSVNSDKAGEICADVWVHNPDKAEAENLARSLVMDFGYRVVKLDMERAIRASEISRYRPDAQRDFHRAIQQGIAISFAGQLPPGHTEGTVQIHRMEKPHHPSGSKH